MAWDEKLFSYFLKKWSTRRKPVSESEIARENAKVTLEEISSRLRLLACALTGEALEISEAEDIGGHRGSRLFLPSVIQLYSTRELNLKAYLFRLVYSAAVYEMNLTLREGEKDQDKARALSALAIPKALSLLEAELPLSREWLIELQHETAHEKDLTPWHMYFYLACNWKIPEGTDTMSIQLAESLLDLARMAHFADAIKHPLLADLSALMSDSVSDFLLLFGRLMPAADKTDTFSLAPEGLSVDSLSSGTQKKGKSREHVDEVILKDKKEDDAPLVHVFEKVFTAEEYNSGKKTLDGSDELEDHEEALDELNLRHVIRSRDRAHSIYKSDIFIDGGAPDLAENLPPSSKSFSYDEWDYKKQSYRKNWCSVHETKPRPRVNQEDIAALSALPKYHQKTIKKLRADLEIVLNRRRWRNRQADGTEFDLDAIVDMNVDLKCRHTPSNKTYLQRRRTDRDFAATVLVDMSLSTDSWVENQHVIQVARESVLVLSEVFKVNAHSVSVAGFYSNTRRDCRYVKLKEFREDWRQFRRRIPAMTPTGYTRIGPALRHATDDLIQTGAKKKLLLLVSDGKPTDYDRYEGTYGVQDVRQAIKEARQANIHVRSLAIDSNAKFYLPQMFGAGGYQILSHPALLAQALSKVFSQCLT